MIVIHFFPKNKQILKKKIRKMDILIENFSIKGKSCLSALGFQNKKKRGNKAKNSLLRYSREGLFKLLKKGEGLTIPFSSGSVGSSPLIIFCPAPATALQTEKAARSLRADFFNRRLRFLTARVVRLRSSRFFYEPQFRLRVPHLRGSGDGIPGCALSSRLNSITLTVVPSPLYQLPSSMDV